MKTIRETFSQLALMYMRATGFPVPSNVAQALKDFDQRIAELESVHNDLVYLLEQGRLKAYANIYEMLKTAGDLAGIEAGERVRYRAFLNERDLAQADLRLATLGLAGRLA